MNRKTKSSRTAKKAKGARKHSSTKKKRKELAPFDKYVYYTNAVQSPGVEAEFMDKLYRDLRKKSPKSMREDFCGTFATCSEWVKLSPKHVAIGVDIDAEPLAYGHEHYFKPLKPAEQKRLTVIKKSVLDKNLPSVDMVCALNFSYFCFKQRALLKDYFVNVFRTLNKDGVLVLDCFGGSQCYEANLEVTEHEDLGFEYHWDQESYNPINNHAQFSIHFKRDGEKIRKRAFTYDWRLWSPAELSDILAEAGFKKSMVYWEGSDRNGEGNGKFKPSTTGEECESWIAYIVALK